MLKHKVIFPEKARLESPYQLEDCQRRLGYLKRDVQPIHFTPIDDNTVQFRIRRVESRRVAFPMIAFEICGTLRRWGGTGTAIEDYRLKRLTARVDTWVVLFVMVSILVSLVLMFPALLNIRNSFQILVVILFVAAGVGLLPFAAWARQTRTLNIERDIDHLHQAIMRELAIDDELST